MIWRLRNRLDPHIPHYLTQTMTAQTYIVAGGNAYIIDSINGTPYGAPVNTDGTIDWDCTYDFDPRMDEDLMIQTNQILHTLKQLAQLTHD